MWYTKTDVHRLEECVKTRIQNNAAYSWGFSGLCAFATTFAASKYAWVLALRLSTLLIGLGLCYFYHAMLPLLRGRRAVFALCGGFAFALCQAIGDVILHAYPIRNIPPLLLGYWPLYAALASHDPCD